MDRRTFLGSAAMGTAALALLGCKRKPEVHAAPAPAPSPSPSLPPPAADPRADLDVREWDLSEGDVERRCTVIVPKPLPQGLKLPLLVALHGMGETVSAKKGANGWLDSYKLDRALHRLRKPPLNEQDFEGFVTGERLAQIDRELAVRAFGGLVVACPYLPREIGTNDLPYDVYAKWLGDKLLPKLRAETPVFDTPTSTGIDGVSLGGITALRIGLAHPELFGAVGALQPAVNDTDVAESLADTIATTLGARPLRIVTSADDAYRATLEALHDKLVARKVPHEFFVAEGPHDYAWNQGPGGIEMLLWHDRVQRRG